MKSLSLRARLLIAFGLFGLALCISFGWLLPRLVLWTEDRIFERQFQAQWELARAQVLAGVQPTEQPAPGMRFGLQGQGLNPELAAFVSNLAPGFHEFNDRPRAGWPSTELLFLIEDLPDGRRLHGIYDVAPYEGMEGLWDRLYLTTMGAGLALTLVALVLGVGLVRQLSRALLELELLARREPRAPAPLVVERPDEIGRIARAWSDASAQAEAALERERRFTRDASHELRTPITAAAGALENLADLANSDPAQRLVWVERARTALAEMEELVGAFLWLARDNHGTRDLEPIAVEAELRRLLLEVPASGPGVRLEFQGRPVLQVPVVVLRVVLGNLLRNACNHAGSGPVEVQLEAQALQIDNPLAEAELHSSRPQGFGFGLSIVEDLCRRFGWRLTLGPQAGQRFRARVEFAAPAPQEGATQGPPEPKMPKSNASA